MVLARDEVQRAAQQPVGDQRAVGQRGVDVRRPVRGAAGAQRQPGGAQVLRLHREEPCHGGARVEPVLAGQQLGGRPAPAQLVRRHSATRMR